MQRIYLAGPEVFLPDALEIAANKKALCAAYGFIGIFPLDNELESNEQTPSKPMLAEKISQANEQLIRQSDLLVANMTPFRGISADPGTCYEMGYARGLGKPVYAYSNLSTTLIERAREHYQLPEHSGVDPWGQQIEDFDLHDNLMLEGALMQQGSQLFCEQVNKESLYHDLSAFKALLASL